MRRRLTTAGILLSIFALGFFIPALNWLLVLVTAAIAVLCTWELTAMMKLKGLRVYRRVASWGVLALVLEAAWTGMEYAIIVFGVAVCLAWLVRMPGEIKGAWADVSATCFTLAYVGIPFAALTKIFLAGTDGKAFLVLMLAIIWTTDSCALLVGKRIGRNKLWPKISPGKTWEGSLGGVAGALVITGVFALLFGRFFPTVQDWEWAVFAILFSIVGQVGDLAESLLKRDVGVKDSGSELTGHGGFLDLMDAVMFAALPLLAYLHLLHPGVFASQ